MVAQLYLDGTETNLESICRELFIIFENETIQNYPNRVKEYFKQRVIQDELSGLPQNIKLYVGLEEIVKKDVLPAYSIYTQEKKKILERKAQRNVGKYIVGAIFGVSILELILTKGRSLRPQLLVPSVALDCLIGYGAYRLVGWNDERAIKKAEHKFFNTVKGRDYELQLQLSYDIQQVLSKGNLLEGEAFVVLSKYDSSDNFWEDYQKARTTDPTTKTALEQLNLPFFRPFLEYHLNEDCSFLQREQRFNYFFQFANDYFLRKDRESYVLRHLESRVVDRIVEKERKRNPEITAEETRIKN